MSQFRGAVHRIASVDALGNRSTTVYDNVDQSIANIDALGYRSTVNYDTANRHVSSQDANGNLWTAIYDNGNRLLANIHPLGFRSTHSYDAASQPIAMQDPLGYLHTRSYDGNGRLQASIDPLGNYTTPIYDTASRQLANVDPLGNRVSTIYDANSRVLAQQDGRGYLTSFIFDGAGQQLAIVDANGGRTSRLYDARGLLYASQDQLGAFTTFVFDGVGNISKRTDARGWVTTYTVDALNRTSGTLYVDGTRVTNTWDVTGRQITMQDVTGVTTFGYDARGVQTSVVNGIGKALTYSFDGAMNRNVLLNPDGGRTTYGYDAQNRLTSIVNPFAETTTLTYDALNRELKKTLGNGVSVSHMYDAAGRETVLENRTSAGVALSVYSASYDNIGNRTSVQELDGTRVTYSFDASYQLTNEQRSGGNAYNTTYSYDPLGNRLSKNDGGQMTNYAYNRANELTLLTPPTGQPTTNSWDANGNLTLENAGGVLTTYTWNAENRLLAVASANGTETYTYSADGLREKKVNISGTIYYVRDNHNILFETDVNLVTQAICTDLPGIWGGKFSLRRSGASHFYVPDHQGNTRQLTDASQTVTDTLLTDAWGKEIVNTGATVNSFEAFGQWGYYKDNSSRLYVAARHLRTDLGRWLSRDPISLQTDASSRYNYVSNRITVEIDPSGLLGIDIVVPARKTTNCGGAYFAIRWLVAADANGWVVQHARRTADVHYCDGTRKNPENVPIGWSNYFEAWQVVHGKILAGPPFFPPIDVSALSDEFRTVDEGHTKGCVRVIGVAGFTNVVDAVTPTPPWTIPPPGFPSGRLPWSDRRPGWWPPPDFPACHCIKVCWCCCPPKPQPTSIHASKTCGDLCL